MQLTSFIDVISNDNRYSECTLATLATDTLSRYELEIRGTKKKLKACNFSDKKVQKLRLEILSILREKQNIIIIDQNRNKIFTSICNDPFFKQLSENVGSSNARFRVKLINEERTLKTIVNKMLPVVVISNEEQQQIAKRKKQAAKLADAIENWDSNEINCVIS